MMFALQRKKDKLFYSQSYKWGEIEKAKIFKRKGDLFLWLNHNYHNGLYCYNEKTIKTKMEDVNIIGVKLTVTGVQKEVNDEYKNKQLLSEIEKGN